MVHPLEYEATPEGRIAADARELIVWMYEEQRHRDRAYGRRELDYPPVPDFRDFLDHLRPVIQVELLRAQVRTAEFAVVNLALLKVQLAEAEELLILEKAKRADRADPPKQLGP